MPALTDAKSAPRLSGLVCEDPVGKCPHLLDEVTDTTGLGRVRPCLKGNQMQDFLVLTESIHINTKTEKASGTLYYFQKNMAGMSQESQLISNLDVILLFT